MNERLIAIGDIHGCSGEFAELLDKLRLRKADRIILLGDLVNRGPDSRGVLDLAKAVQAKAILGNHELRLLKYHDTGDKSLLKNGDLRTYQQLAAEDFQLFRAMPLTEYCRELNTVFVHGGFLPGQPWENQPAEVVTRIQVIDAAGRPRKRSESPQSPAWADCWKGPPFVVYGHTPRSKIHKLKWSAGIDTACVMGGFLTAYVLPEKRFVQVKARKKYAS